jgi:hypothetical protein
MEKSHDALKGTYLQLHLEPDEPLEIGELTAALNAFSRQYQSFAAEQEAGSAMTSGKLLIANVAPGSIDINFVPAALLGAIPLLPQLFDHAASLATFANSLKELADLFSGGKGASKEPTVKDCDDAINLFSPTAQHGGTQTINIIRDSAVYVTVVISEDDAKQAVAGAARKKAELQFPKQASRQRVSMIWRRLDRSDAKTQGVRSPDLGLIEEIDPKPHAILFTDEMTYLKREMIADVENPYLKVYYVDVEISRVGESVTGYRITGYHGRDDFDGEAPGAV